MLCASDNVVLIGDCVVSDASVRVEVFGLKSRSPTSSVKSRSGGAWEVSSKARSKPLPPVGSVREN